MAGYGDRPFGLNQVRLVSHAATPVAVTLAASMTMKFTPRMMGGELKGSDSLLAVASFVEALEWSLEEGGIPLEAWAILTGWTATESGSTPNRQLTMQGLGATAMPYFTIYGKSLGEALGDDVHVKIWKAKLTGNIEGQFQYGQFYVTACTGVAVKDTSLTPVRIFDIVQHETAVALPSTYP